MNIYDVSEKAGVSIATVSRVINGNSNVSEKTKQRVLIVMEELGYTPNVFARGLGLNTMKTIGIMCTDSSDIYLANAVYFLERELRFNAYDSILCCTGTSLDNKMKYLNLLLSKRVDGIILVGSKFLSSDPDTSDNDYILTAAKQLPVMLVNGQLTGDNIFSTMCDDESAVYSVTDNLVKNGQSNIVYLYTSTSYSGKNKLAGFKKALEDNHLNVNPAYFHMCTKSISRAKEYLNELYSNNIIFDAVVTSDDSLAVGAVKFAFEHNLKIPNDLSIVGYNNSVLANCTEPELTSIDSNVESLCVTTVKSLMKVFSGGKVPERTIISADLIKRNTTNF